MAGSSSGGIEVGRVGIKVVPDLDGFTAKLDAELSKMSKNLSVDIKANLDTVDFTKDLAAAEALVKDLNLTVGVKLDNAEFLAEMEALRLAAERAQGVTLPVHPETAKFQAEMLAAIKSINDSIDLNVEANLEGLDRIDRQVKLKAKELNLLAKTNPVKIPVKPDVDTKGLKKASKDVDSSLTKMVKSFANFSKGGGNPFIGEMGRLKASANAIAPALLGIGYTFAALTPQVLSLAYDLGNLSGLLAGLPAVIGAGAAVMGTFAIATHGMGDALSAIGKDADKFNEATKGLAKPAKDFVLQVQKMQPQVTSLRKAVQGAFFTGFAAELRQLSTTLLPVVRTGLTDVAEGLNLTARRVANYLESARGMDVVREVLTATAVAVKAASTGIASFAEALGTVAADGAAFLPQLAAGFSDVGARFRDFIAEASASGAVTDFIAAGLQSARDLVTALWGAVRVVVALSKAASEAGGGTLAGLATTLSGIATTLESSGAQKAITELFAGINAATSQITDVLPSVGQAFKDLLPSIVTIMSAIGKLLGSGITVVAQTFSKWAPAINSFTAQAGPVFAQIVDALATGIATLTSWIDQFPISIALIAPVLLGVTGPLGDMVIVIGLLAGAWAGLQALMPQIVAYMQPVITAFQALQPVFTAFATAVGGVFMAAWAGVVAGFQRAQPALAALGADFQSMMVEVVKAAGVLAAVFGPALTAIQPIVKFVADSLIGGLVFAITGTLSVIVNFVRLVAALFSGNWAGAWKAAGAIVGGFGNILKGALNVVVGVVGAFIGTIGKALVSGFKAIGNSLKAAGTSIGNFFMQGIQAGINAGKSLVMGAVSAIASLIPGPIKKILKIQSPSRVMIQLGRYVTQGFYKGISNPSEVSKVKSVATSLANKVKDAFNAGKISRSSELQALKIIDSGTDRLKGIAKAREKVADQLKAAQDKLTAALKVKADYAAQVKNEALAFGAYTNSDVSNSGDMLQSMKDRLKVTQNYVAMLKTLVKRGLNNTTYKELVDKGVEAGTAYAQSLLTGGTNAIREVNSLQKSLGAAATSLGSSASTTLYQAGVDAAQGLVDGLKSKYKALSDTMKSLAHELVKAIKKALKIHSPSRVFRDDVGANMALGIAEGVTGKSAAVSTALDKVTSYTSSRGVGMTSATGAAVNIQNMYTVDPDAAAKAIARKQRDLNTVYSLRGI